MAIAKDFTFIGRLSLDFAQTGDMGYGARFERLTSPSELERWLSLSPLNLAKARTTSADLTRARRLRRAIWRIANALLARATPDPRDVRLLNATARQPGLVKELDLDGKSSHWRRRTAAGALATIAQDAVALFGDRDARARLRRCENPRCRAVFYDDSRPGRRRWCASTRCGDRIRAQAYRNRRRASRPKSQLNNSTR
jgi:predicted RNA-binding Zn ribbon-like protein